MSQEIIYTSSPQGLRPGSFGFCTVATTPGMATSLAERLESLSGYRHVYTPGDPKAGLNPVVHSHLILKVGGQKLHVLSRIADAGLDYSQRTNKLAHHVALDVNELVPGGPAWVLAQPGFAETRWAGNPRVLPAGRKAPAGNLSPSVCRAWQQATGDAGWAGVLAQNGVDGKRPAYVVFSEGTDVLPLLIEAQSLLPPAKRWEVSFSTFFTRLPPGVDCQWRCVLAGSPEGEAALAQRGDLVIDLTKSLGEAPSHPMSQCARTGESFQNSPQSHVHADTLVRSSPGVVPVQTHLSQIPPALDSVEYPTLGPPPLHGSPPNPNRRRHLLIDRPPTERTFAKSALFGVAASAIVILFCGFVAFWAMKGGSAPPEIVEHPSVETKAADISASKAEDADVKDSSSEQGTATQTLAAGSADPAPPPIPSPPPMPPEPLDASPPCETKPALPPPVPPFKFGDVPLQFVNELPTRESDGSSSDQWLRPTTLLTVPQVYQPVTFDILLLGGDNKNTVLELKKRADHYSVVSAVKSGGLTISSADLAEVFTMTEDGDTELRFRWNRKALQSASGSHLLRYCALGISVNGSDRLPLRLAPPTRKPSVALSNKSFSGKVHIGPDEHRIETPSSLALSVDPPQGFPLHAEQDWIHSGDDQKAVFTSRNNKGLSITVTLGSESNNSGPNVSLVTLAVRTQLTVGGKNIDIESHVTQLRKDVIDQFADVLQLSSEADLVESKLKSELKSAEESQQKPAIIDEIKDKLIKAEKDANTKRDTLRQHRMRLSAYIAALEDPSARESISSLVDLVSSGKHCTIKATLSRKLNETVLVPIIEFSEPEITPKK